MDLEKKSAVLNIQTEIENKRLTDCEVTAEQIVYDSDKNQLAKTESAVSSQAWDNTFCRQRMEQSHCQEKTLDVLKERMLILRASAGIAGAFCAGSEPGADACVRVRRMPRSMRRSQICDNSVTNFRIFSLYKGDWIGYIINKQ